LSLFKGENMLDKIFPEAIDGVFSEKTGKLELAFQDICLNHKKCIVNSRSECDTSVILGGRKFKCPVVPANMKSVVSVETCEFLCQNNWFYIMHRFGIDNYEFTKNMQEKGYISSVSIGVNNDSYDQLKRMSDDKVIPEYITLDIANAWSVKSQRMIDFVKKNFPESFLIVGNYSSTEAVRELEDWGADATKLGIAGGKSCTTYMATGFARPQFSAVLDCAKVSKKPVISDGSIVNVGDIAKAITAGAEMVMCGNLFAGYKEGAGEIIEIENKSYKQYFGSASYNNTLNDRHVEGKCILVDYKGEMGRLLEKIEDGLKSAISYAGGKDISALRSVTWGYRNSPR